MSKKYTKRITMPAATDKHFINYKSGGYNTCISIKNGFVLPNCTGYAQGRWLELFEAKAVDWELPACNAEDFIETAKKAGYKTGNTPLLGAIICWKQGQTKNSSDGCGHVAVVEEIYADGSILVSESGYNAYNFKTEKIAKGYARSGKVFQGFIYNGIDFIEDAPKTATSESKTYFRVQLASFTVKDSATKYAQSVRNNGFAVVIKQYGKYYRVQVGAYEQRANAEAMLTKVKAKGYKSAYITTES